MFYEQPIVTDAQWEELTSKLGPVYVPYVHGLPFLYTLPHDHRSVIVESTVKLPTTPLCDCGICPADEVEYKLMPIEDVRKLANRLGLYMRTTVMVTFRQ